jgi:hypothetical protein
MKRSKYARGLLLTILLLILINQYVYSFFFPLGCEGKSMVLKGDKTGYAVALKSGYSFQEIRKFIINNPKYSIRDGGWQLYVSRTIDGEEIVLIIFQYELDGFMMRKSNVEKVKYDFYIYRGASCHTPDWLVSQRVNSFIRELNLPQDLEKEFMESYVVLPSISWSFGF